MSLTVTAITERWGGWGGLTARQPSANNPNYQIAPAVRGNPAPAD